MRYRVCATTAAWSAQSHLLPQSDNTLSAGLSLARLPSLTAREQGLHRTLIDGVLEQKSYFAFVPQLQGASFEFAAYDKRPSVYPQGMAYGLSVTEEEGQQRFRLFTRDEMVWTLAPGMPDLIEHNPGDSVPLEAGTLVRYSGISVLIPEIRMQTTIPDARDRTAGDPDHDYILEGPSAEDETAYADASFAVHARVAGPSYAHVYSPNYDGVIIDQDDGSNNLRPLLQSAYENGATELRHRYFDLLRLAEKGGVVGCARLRVLNPTTLREVHAVLLRRRAAGSLPK